MIYQFMQLMAICVFGILAGWFARAAWDTREDNE